MSHGGVKLSTLPERDGCIDEGADARRRLGCAERDGELHLLGKVRELPEYDLRGAQSVHGFRPQHHAVVGGGHAERGYEIADIMNDLDREPASGRQPRYKLFVIKFGVPSELIARELWDEHGKIAFASSANLSGNGNSGRVDGIGERINNAADLVIAADDYVRGIQPGANEQARYEQGVMVSMVDADGRLIPEQRGEAQFNRDQLSFVQAWISSDYAVAIDNLS